MGDRRTNMADFVSKERIAPKYAPLRSEALQVCRLEHNHLA